MTYTHSDFGKALANKLNETDDVVKLARWANKLYLEKCRDFEEGLLQVVMTIIAMEEGKEFELTRGELKKLSDDLIKSNN